VLCVSAFYPPSALPTVESIRLLTHGLDNRFSSVRCACRWLIVWDCTLIYSALCSAPMFSCCSVCIGISAGFTRVIWLCFHQRGYCSANCKFVLAAVGTEQPHILHPLQERECVIVSWWRHNNKLIRICFQHTCRSHISAGALRTIQLHLHDEPRALKWYLPFRFWTLKCFTWPSLRSEFLATDPEVRVRFPALPDFLRSSGSGTGSTQPREYNWGAVWKKK
jgi:hypothetical protein